MVFCISALFAYVGSRASFWEPLGSLWDAFLLHFRSKWASWAAFCLQSRPPGEPFGLQVGLLGGLGASKFASLAASASKFASSVSFRRPSWPSRRSRLLRHLLLPYSHERGLFPRPQSRCSMLRSCSHLSSSIPIKELPGHWVSALRHDFL